MDIAPDFFRMHIRMKLRWYNRNYVGVHFGGSLYAMTDPFYMLMLIQILGKEYIVWDKGATITFKKPGQGTVHAYFALTPADIETIKAKTASGEKYEPQFTVDVVDDSGTVVATALKTLYIRKKRDKVKSA